MISEISKGLMRQKFLGEVISQKYPKLYATCGIPGAGKSYFVDEQLRAGNFPKDSYILNPDRVMIALPEYQDDVVNIGAQAAYQKWELPVREFAYAMADDALNRNANIIKDMGCANPLSLELVKNLKKAGYQISMYHIRCDVDVAFDRINQRDFQISQKAVRNRFELLNSMLSQYRELADEFVDLDNNNFKTAYKIISSAA